MTNSVDSSAEELNETGCSWDIASLFELDQVLRHWKLLHLFLPKQVDLPVKLRYSIGISNILNNI